jgi:ribokinase
MVVTMGARDAVLLDRLDVIQYPGYQMAVVDTTSAGDAFIGAFAVALARGMPREDLLRIGCASGALAVARPGAQPSIPTAAEIEQFLTSRGVLI